VYRIIVVCDTSIYLLSTPALTLVSFARSYYLSTPLFIFGAVYIQENDYVRRRTQKTASAESQYKHHKKSHKAVKAKARTMAWQEVSMAARQQVHP
jgi:hypothetical protein